MVNFGKRLAKKASAKPVDPIKIYSTLDRTHDKGPLRPSQEAVLQEWNARQASTRDVIVKLHTGQGKTLVGLLMLQSRLNAERGPVVYLCPDHFLIAQTCEQARQFGIRTCTAEDDLPDDFLNSSHILVTSVQKLFNGITKFGLNKTSIEVDTVLMDDAHACADRIREACRIRIPSDEPAYAALKALFATELEQQGVGTFADIENAKREALLPVPYWAWTERESEVASILSAQTQRKSVRFAWPLLRDILVHCQCIVSGAAIEIEPYVPPLDSFGSYSRAVHRIFMSATVTDDAFLVKGLRLSPETITAPLTYDRETWSGEKMVIIPSLIHEEWDRDSIVNGYGKPDASRKYGVVALTPSFARSKAWEDNGALVAVRDTIEDAVNALRRGECEKTVVLVNRYDGVDLPDDTCRILVFDSRPYSESLIDLYAEQVRPGSEATLMRTVRAVEQGMGRSVRGEKDYSVIVVIGSDLVRLIREKATRRFLSPQVNKQIQIGLDVTDMARQELAEGEEPSKAYVTLIKQCLWRDPEWKAYYAEQMDGIVPRGPNESVLKLYAAELAAEEAYTAGDYVGASERLQKLMDDGHVDKDDKAWYLQQRARYHYRSDRTESQALQVAAHKKNRMLLKPPGGVTVTKLTIVSQGRTERIAAWVRAFGTYAEMDVTVSDILGRLRFGVKADNFEHAFDELSRALGFAGERPDKEWKEGPDNLWALDDTRYLIVECKSEVDVTRAEVNKREAEQMNRSAAWFDKHYKGMQARRLIIHPAKRIESAAAFTHDVQGVPVAELRKFEKACREFFKGFEGQNFADLSPQHIQKMVDSHHLSIDDLLTLYSRKLKDVK
ncbi:DEAD/DEAH box helicase [Bradyrhizobium sp.]|uniref:DEAD/DEAH box helicase n=1 Tax=Bradyrhizobium sp. TaxID=376 RepID=UPI00260E1687|nr:DEAD/DEAH box helicase [Bradyrhizobium sp.]